MSFLRNTLFAVLISGMLAPVFSADIDIATSVDRTVVGVNQTFTLTVEISGDKANSGGDPKIPDLSAFAVSMGSSGTSQNIQLINGKMTVSKSMTFTFMATTIGKFEIPPATIIFNGNTFSSKAIKIEIVQSSAPQRQPGQRGTRPSPGTGAEEQIDQESLFLHVTASKNKVYVNEPVILSYKIYTNVTVTQYGMSKLPNTAGFWVEEFPLGNQPKTYEEIYKGRKYIVAEIRRVAMFPTDAGKKTISPMEIECSVRVQTRRRSIFDSFFDDPFFGRSIRKVVNSQPVTIDVLPLPDEGKPSNFSGLVGNFNISASVDKKNVKTNDAISLKVKINGSGNVKMIPNPVVDVPPDFEKYPPKESETINRTETGVNGSKIFEYVLIPRYPGKQTIKPVTFSYFDVNKRAYQYLRTPELVIDVEKGDEEFISVGSGLSKEEVKLLGQDIRYIQFGAPEFKKIGGTFHKSSYFILLLIVPVVLILSSLGYRKHLDKINANVAYARSRKANQLAMKRLHKAKKLLHENTQKEFYAEIANSLMGFLGDKFNIASAGIITDEVEGLMKKHNIPETVISQYLACLQMCDYQRFAPSSAKLDEMKVFFNEAKNAIVALEKVI